MPPIVIPACTGTTGVLVLSVRISRKIMNKNKYLHVFPVCCLAVVAGAAAQAQPVATGSGHTYPAKPIRLIVPYPPGGGTDVIARTLAQKMTEVMGQQVLVDNRPGANGIIGSDVVAKAAPDGYTALITLGATDLRFLR